MVKYDNCAHSDGVVGKRPSEVDVVARAAQLSCRDGGVVGTLLAFGLGGKQLLLGTTLLDSPRG